MRKLGKLVFLLAGLLTISPLLAFDYYPTQTPKKIVKAPPAQVSPKLLESVLEDETLAKGTELMSVSFDGARPESILGNISEPLSGDLGEATKKFILTHGNLFNVPVSRSDNVVKLVKSEEEAGANHFHYQMVLDGVPVHEALIDLHVGKDKRIQLANGSFPVVKGISNQIAIGRIQALAAAKRALGAKTIRGVPRAELVVVPENSRGTMAFLAKMATDEPLGDWEVLIDAQTGKEISRVNQMVFATGKGAVYMSNPLVSKVTTESLLNLTGHGLEGKFAKAVNAKGAGSVSDTDTHVFDPANTHFDEVMIYFQVNRIHDFFAGLGFNKLDRPIKATVHYKDGFDNAYYSPMEGAMYFGDGTKLNDLAKEEDVAFHEYSHAVLSQIVSLTYSGESGAMNEGQADFFACSFTNDPKLGQWTVAKMGKDCIRNQENSLHYPQDVQNEVHADGRIWGGALWDLRKALGATVAQKVVFGSFSYLKSGKPKFVDGMNAILTADANLFGGQNKAKIIDVFQKRGISTATTDGRLVTSDDIKKTRLFRDVQER